MPHTVRRKMPLTERNGDLERRSPVWLAADCDVPAVQSHKFADERQSDASAFVGARAHVLDTMEPRKNICLFVGRNPGASVGHGQNGFVVNCTELQGDAAFEGKFVCIGEQVKNDLFPHVFVDKCILRHWLAFDIEAQTGLLDQRTKGACKVSRELGQFNRFVIRQYPSSFEARKIKQSVNELQQAKAVSADCFELLPLAGPQ